MLSALSVITISCKKEMMTEQTETNPVFDGKLVNISILRFLLGLSGRLQRMFKLKLPQPI
jgi:hypothetical protein